MADPIVNPKHTLQLAQRLWSAEIRDDPYAFVMYAFPWGQKNTRLEHIKGPRTWQKDELCRIRDHITENKRLIATGHKPKVYYSATASGRGVGKSALVSWLSLWFASCIYGGTTIISANTDSQLSSKTFGEIGKWRTMAINEYWFEMLQKKLQPKPFIIEQLRTHRKIDSTYYYVEGTLWDEDKPDNFAGAHNELGLMVIFDEASGIPQPVWDVTEGFFTDISIYRFWLVFSNPRRNTGPFYDCFENPDVKQFWYTRQLDGREVEDGDQATYEKIIKQNGPDSDQAKVEVYGQFPAQSDRQFISRSLVKDAQVRDFDKLDDQAALVMGVDPARFGEDKTVIRFRQGRDARSIPPTIIEKRDNMFVANKVADLIELHKPDAVFIDSGAGAGIIDRLREMGYLIFEVGFGTASSDPAYFDHRTELWAKMRDWMPEGQIDHNEKLEWDLCAPEFDYAGKGLDKVKLESKEDMKRRSLKHSTDQADALALTFHKKIARKDMSTSRSRRKQKFASNVDYDIFGRRD